jgi:arylsulfatase A-like enzyme
MWQRLLRSRTTYIALAVLLVLGAVASMVRIHPAARSSGDLDDLKALRDRKDINVVFVLVDTLRADRLAAYGYSRDTTPFLSQVAQNGIRFAHVRAQSSWTKTSMASLWSATFPLRNGVIRYDDGLPDALPLAAEIFQKAGFKTGGIIRNGWVGANFGFGRGFDVYIRPGPAKQEALVRSEARSGHPIPGTDYDATVAGLEFIRATAGERFFLYLHLMDVHQYVYEEKSALFGSGYSDAYDNSIHWVDRNIGVLFKGMQDLGVLDKTLVVIASDHGEAFYEHGGEGHGRNLYSEVTVTPWILSPPFNLKGGVTVEPWVRNVDIFPTVFDLLGLPAYPSAQGQSLVPLIERTARGEPIDGAAPAPDYSFLNRVWGRVNVAPRPTVSFSEGDQRLIVDLCNINPPQLFDIKTDPGEQKNLAEEQPERVAEIRARLEAQVAADEGSQAETKALAVESFRLEQLRALGYVVGPGDQRPEFAPEPEDMRPCDRADEPLPPRAS